MANRKNSRRANRRAERKSRRQNAGRRNSRRNAMTRRSRGVFSTLYAPVNSLVGTAENVIGTGLNVAVGVPTRLVKGATNVVGVAKNTVKGAFRNTVSGVRRVGHNVTSGVNRAIAAPFSRKGRKGSRKGRKNSRRNY